MLCKQSVPDYPRCFWWVLFLSFISSFIPFYSAFGTDVTFLYWSDRCARNLPEIRADGDGTMEVGGTALLSGMINELRAEYNRTITLVAGDELQGTALSLVTNGLSEISILNSIGIDAYVPGRREFEYGWTSLLNITEQAEFPILAANITLTFDGNRRHWFPSDTVHNLDGVKVAVIGLVDDDLDRAYFLDQTVRMTSLEVTKIIRNFVGRRRDSCDVMVAVTNLGWNRDSLLATKIDGLDVIIGSGDRTAFDPPREVNGVVIVQGGAYGRVLGRLTVSVNAVTREITGYEGELLHVEEGAVTPNNDITKLISRLDRKHLRHLDQQIGTLQSDWDLRTNRQCNLAQWTADVIRQTEPRAWAVVINNDDLKSGLRQGPITERNIWDICPYDVPIIVFRATGGEIERMVLRQLSHPEPFFTWSGLRVEIEEGEGDSLFMTTSIRGEAIIRDQYYLISTTSSVWNNLQAYCGLNPQTHTSFVLPDVNQRELMINMVKTQRIIDTTLDDRWIIRRMRR